MKESLKASVSNLFRIKRSHFSLNARHPEHHETSPVVQKMSRKAQHNSLLQNDAVLQDDGHGKAISQVMNSTLPSQLTTQLHQVWQNPIYFLAFGFGTGLINPAPGTWGTLAGVLVYVLIAHCSPLIYLTLTVAAFIAGSFWCHRVARELGVHDYSGIVWDEVVGYLLTMYSVPFHLSWIILGFLLFRVFDIWKPQPIGWIDRRVKGGLGIMLDDVLAAIPAWLILQILIWIFE